MVAEGMTMKLALIGLGKMGIEIGGVLLRAGHSLVVYNRTAGKTAILEEKGATVATTPKEAASEADVILTMVFDDAALEHVTQGKNGILESMPREAVHVCLSTIAVETARRMEKQHAERGREYVSAPVLGRPDAAQQAKLIVMVGGSEKALAKVLPILDIIGRKTFTVGKEPWQANLFKLCSNFMISAMLESFGEAQALVRKAGSEPSDFVELMTEFFGSAIYRNYGTLIATGKYDPPGGTLALGLKDNRQLLDAAAELLVPLPVASLVRDQMLAAAAAGNAELDWSSLTDTAIRNSGQTPRRTNAK
jgi:3-hydroxyisobutyrate dehydrogenase-like beta-hydroxyacid dehydrogenase